MCNFPLFRADLLKYGRVRLPKYVSERHNAIVVGRPVMQSLIDANYLPSDAFVPIPCGKCIACRLERSKQWAQRIVAESFYHDENWFLTLTYDDDHLPSVQTFFDPITGQCADSPALNYKDFQDFNKRLRSYCDDHYGVQIRFFTGLEYGERSFRPHGHSIMFGLPIPDLKPYKTSHGNMLYRSSMIDKIWRNGNVIIGELNSQTASYTASYCMKKSFGRQNIDRIRADIVEQNPFMARYFHIDRNISETSLMSRRPGIGRQYFLDHKNDMYQRDTFALPGVGEVKPSRYYDNLYDIENHFDLLMRKERAKMRAQINNPVLSALTDFDVECYNEVKERSLFNKVLLKRKTTV